jgi:hypothetical protein
MNSRLHGSASALNKLKQAERIKRAWRRLRRDAMGFAWLPAPLLPFRGVVGPLLMVEWLGDAGHGSSD